MRKLTFIQASAVALFVATSAHAQFVIDQTPKQLREAEGKLAIEDLAIEETGLTTGGDFCSENGELFVRRVALLASEKSTYGINFRITRKQGDAVTVEAVAGEKLDSLRNALLSTFRSAANLKCHIFDIAPENRFRVKSVNGVTSVSELLGKIK